MAKKLKIITAVGHPADVYFLKDMISGLQGNSHQVIVVAREKEFTQYLLETFNIEFIPLSRHKKSLGAKLLDAVFRWVKLYRMCRRIKPDISFGVGDFLLPQIGFLQGFPSIVFTDVESVVHDHLITFPFASFILTPQSYEKQLGQKQVRINSIKESGYINEAFSPDPCIWKDLKIEPGSKFILVRFVSHSAMHDLGYKGLSDKEKINLIHRLSSKAQVFISSEAPLPRELEPLRLKISPEKIHSVMYHASLLYGESATMAAEAALMGTPCVFIDPCGRGYINALESDYGLVHAFMPDQKSVEASVGKALSLLSDTNTSCNYRVRAESLRKNQINITRFLIHFIEKYGSKPRGRERH